MNTQAWRARFAQSLIDPAQAGSKERKLISQSGTSKKRFFSSFESISL
jgi:hypothetical protein